MTGRLAPGLTIGESLIHGKGCFAAVAFHEDQQIAEYVGERISMIEAERRRRAFGEDCICDVDNEWAIEGSRGGNGTQYVNHSCQPNSYVIVSESGSSFTPSKKSLPAKRSRQTTSTNYTPTIQRVDAARPLAMNQQVLGVPSIQRRNKHLTNILDTRRRRACEG